MEFLKKYKLIIVTILIIATCTYGILIFNLNNKMANLVAYDYGEGYRVEIKDDFRYVGGRASFIDPVAQVSVSHTMFDEKINAEIEFIIGIYKTVLGKQETYLEYSVFDANNTTLAHGIFPLDEDFNILYDKAEFSGDMEEMKESFERNKTTIDACINNADSLWHIR